MGSWSLWRLLCLSALVCVAVEAVGVERLSRNARLRQQHDAGGSPARGTQGAQSDRFMQERDSVVFTIDHDHNGTALSKEYDSDMTVQKGSACPRTVWLDLENEGGTFARFRTVCKDFIVRKDTGTCHAQCSSAYLAVLQLMENNKAMHDCLSNNAKVAARMDVLKGTKCGEYAHALRPLRMSAELHKQAKKNDIKVPSGAKQAASHVDDVWDADGNPVSLPGMALHRGPDSTEHKNHHPAAEVNPNPPDLKPKPKPSPNDVPPVNDTVASCNSSGVFPMLVKGQLVMQNCTKPKAASKPVVNTTKGPCNPNPCPKDKPLCVPEPKNCFTTPCPQYSCWKRSDNKTQTGVYDFNGADVPLSSTPGTPVTNSQGLPTRPQDRGSTLSPAQRKACLGDVSPVHHVQAQCLDSQPGKDKCRPDCLHALQFLKMSAEHSSSVMRCLRLPEWKRTVDRLAGTACDPGRLGALRLDVLPESTGQGFPLDIKDLTRLGAPARLSNPMASILKALVHSTASRPKANTHHPAPAPVDESGHTPKPPSNHSTNSTDNSTDSEQDEVQDMANSTVQKNLTKKQLAEEQRKRELVKGELQGLALGAADEARIKALEQHLHHVEREATDKKASEAARKAELAAMEAWKKRRLLQERKMKAAPPASLELPPNAVGRPHIKTKTLPDGGSAEPKPSPIQPDSLAVYRPVPATNAEKNKHVQGMDAQGYCTGDPSKPIFDGNGKPVYCKDPRQRTRSSDTPPLQLDREGRPIYPKASSWDRLDSYDQHLLVDNEGRPVYPNGRVHEKGNDKRSRVTYRDVGVELTNPTNRIKAKSGAAKNSTATTAGQSQANGTAIVPVPAALSIATPEQRRRFEQRFRDDVDKALQNSFAGIDVLELKAITGGVYVVFRVSSLSPPANTVVKRFLEMANNKHSVLRFGKVTRYLSFHTLNPSNPHPKPLPPMQGSMSLPATQRPFNGDPPIRLSDSDREKFEKLFAQKLKALQKDGLFQEDNDRALRLLIYYDGDLNKVAAIMGGIITGPEPRDDDPNQEPPRPPPPPKKPKPQPQQKAKPLPKPVEQKSKPMSKPKPKPKPPTKPKPQKVEMEKRAETAPRPSPAHPGKNGLVDVMEAAFD